jgi:hypothetical protein
MAPVARTSYRPRPFVLSLRVRILRPGKRPLVVAVTPTYACRYDRSGAVTGLTVVKPRRAPKVGPRLSVRIQCLSRLTGGRAGALAPTVRNHTSCSAYDVIIRAVIPAGLRVISRNRGARIRGGSSRVAVGHPSPTPLRHMRLRVVATGPRTGNQCSTVSVNALVRASARATACIKVSPLPTRRSGLG